MDVEAIFEANAEREILTFLTTHGHLEGAAQGIALQVLGQGRESLRGKQLSVFERSIEPFFHLDCSRCALKMPTSEVVSALTEGDGLCSWCRQVSSHDD